MSYCCDSFSLNYFEFDWRDLKETELYKANKDREEDTMVCIVSVVVCYNNFSCKNRYLIDISHNKETGEDPYFSLEIYQSDEDYNHVKWLGGYKEIKTTKSYKRFCRRVEDAFISLYNCYICFDMKW